MRGAAWWSLAQVVVTMLVLLPTASLRELALKGGTPHLGNDRLIKVVKGSAKNNTILLTIGTEGYLDMLKNMACRLDQLDMTNYVVGAVDGPTVEFCQRYGIPYFTLADINSTFASSSPYAVFNSNEFRLIVRQKQLALAAMLGMGFRVLVVDLDVFLLRSPFEYLNSLPAHDFAMQSAVRMYLMPYEWLNAGFMLVNPTQRAIGALGLIMQRTAGAQVREAQAFNDVLCKLGAFQTGYSSCMEPTANATTLVLEQGLFLGGDVFFRDLTPEVALLADPFVVHFTYFRYGAKQKAMKAIGMWVAGESLDSCEPYAPVENYDQEVIRQNLQASHVSFHHTPTQWRLILSLLFGLWDVWLGLGALVCCVGVWWRAKKKERKGRLE